jgi:acetylornithine deacetylase/succinyl-diaminopimelate desuccinylase-like protein
MRTCVGVLRGRGGGRSVIFNGHVDVVPAQSAHAVDENVPVDELLAARRTYALLAADWCGT